MEYLNLFIEFISRVGFPIAVCVMCFWYINKTNETQRKERDASTEAISNMAHAVENNTAVTSQLVAVVSQWLPVIVQKDIAVANQNERSVTIE